jgi:hypothetical protein
LCPSRRIVTRLTIRDTIIRYGISRGSGVRVCAKNFVPAAVFERSAETRHNLAQVSASDLIDAL